MDEENSQEEALINEHLQEMERLGNTGEKIYLRLPANPKKRKQNKTKMS